MTSRGRLNPSAPTRRPVAPEERDEAALVERAVRRPRPRRRPGRARRTGSSRRTGRTTRTAPARTARRVGVAGEQAPGRVHALLGRVRPVLEAHRPRRRTAGSASGRRRRPRRRRARRGSVSSHTTPLSSVSPEPSSQSVSGATPTPTTHDVGIDDARRRRAARARPGRRPRTAATVTPVRRSTPWSRCSSPQHRRRAPCPTPRTIGCGSASSTVTFEPAAAARGRDLGADEAGADHDDPRARRRAGPGAPWQSSSVRSTKMPASSGWSGRRRGAAPVAITRPSNGELGRRRRASTTRPSRSSAVAAVPSRRSRSRSSYGLAAQRELLALPAPPRGSPSRAAAGRTGDAARRRRARARRHDPRAAASRPRAGPRATRRRWRWSRPRAGTVAAAFASDEPDSVSCLAPLVRALDRRRRDRSRPRAARRRPRPLPPPEDGRGDRRRPTARRARTRR